MNKYYLFFLIIFVFSFFELNAQAVLKTNNVKYYPVTLPLSLKKSPSLAINPNIPNLLENSSSGRSYRGKALEPVAREVYKHNFGVGYQYIDASYNKGVNGLDGLLVKKNLRGNITKVHVVEIKSGNASLNAKSSTPQLSKEWILSGINKSLEEKVKNLKQLQYDMKSKKISSTMLKEKRAEYTKINKERHDLIKSRNMIENDQYRAYQANVKYNDGRLTVEQWEVLGENYKDIPINKRNPDNIFKWSEKKVLVDFSYLDKDNSKLNSFQKKVKQTMFTEFENILRKQNYSETEIASFMSRLKTDKKFNPSNMRLSDDVIRNTATNSINKVIQKNMYIKHGLGLSLLTIASEVGVVLDYANGNIGTTDFIINSGLNAIEITSNFVTKLNPYMTGIYIATDILKKAYSYGTGKITISNALINTTANIAGFVVGGLAVKAVALGAAKIGGAIGSFVSTPVGGIVVSGVVFGVTYGITSSIIKFTGNAIVNKYESIKSPERFDVICNEIKFKYAI